MCAIVLNIWVLGFCLFPSSFSIFFFLLSPFFSSSHLLQRPLVGMQANFLLPFLPLFLFFFLFPSISLFALSPSTQNQDERKTVDAGGCRRPWDAAAAMWCFYYLSLYVWVLTTVAMKALLCPGAIVVKVFTIVGEMWLICICFNLTEIEVL